jgi:hypothetical protein
MPATIYPCSPAVITPHGSCKLTSPDILSHQANDTSFFISGSEGADLAHINLKSVLIGMLCFLLSLSRGVFFCLSRSSRIKAMGLPTGKLSILSMLTWLVTIHTAPFFPTATAQPWTRHIPDVLS